MAAAGGLGETKVIYHLDEEETPYLVKIAVPAERITLGHVKAALNRPGAKYFFKSMDQDFGYGRDPPHTHWGPASPGATPPPASAPPPTGDPRVREPHLSAPRCPSPFPPAESTQALAPSAMLPCIDMI